MRGLSTAGLVAAALLVATTCSVPRSFEAPLGLVVVSSPDAAFDAFDGGANDGGFIVRVFLPVDRAVLRGARPTALAPNGDFAGYGDTRTGTRRLFVSSASKGFEWWDWALGKPSQIKMLDGDGGFCGSASWPDPGPLSISSTAVIGTLANVQRLLPDPVTSECRDGNRAGVYVGEWKAQGCIREADGGLTRLDVFYSPPLSRFISVTPVAVNSVGEVVGSLSYGDAYGRGNPAALLRRPDGGITLLDNGPRPAVARDINEHGVIVGRGRDYDFVPMAIVWPDPFDAGLFLPLPSGMMQAEASAINDDGLVVGLAYDESFGSHGVLWWRGRAYLADELVAGQTNLVVESLDFVNNMPRIVGVALEQVFGVDGGLEAISRWPIIIDVLQLPE
jgi:hypothetical protein